MSVAVYLAAGIYIQRLSSGTGQNLILTPVSTNEDTSLSNNNNESEIIPPGSPTGRRKKPSSRAPEAIEDPLVRVTPRSVHRLLLAALKVAMTALEDSSYAHRRLSRVGGVTELELARLEVSFCFLASFDLIPSSREMEGWVEGVRRMGIEIKAMPAG